MEDYKILNERTVAALQEAVNEHLKSGYSLAGGIAIDVHIENGHSISTYLQAVVKECTTILKLPMQSKKI